VELLNGDDCRSSLGNYRIKCSGPLGDNVERTRGAVSMVGHWREGRSICSLNRTVWAWPSRGHRAQPVALRPAATQLGDTPSQRRRARNTCNRSVQCTWLLTEIVAVGGETVTVTLLKLVRRYHHHSQR
jgi:hypothetical protein